MWVKIFSSIFFSEFRQIYPQQRYEQFLTVPNSNPLYSKSITCSLKYNKTVNLLIKILVCVFSQMKIVICWTEFTAQSVSDGKPKQNLVRAAEFPHKLLTSRDSNRNKLGANLGVLRGCLIKRQAIDRFAYLIFSFSGTATEAGVLQRIDRRAGGQRWRVGHFVSRCSCCSVTQVHFNKLPVL